MKNFRFITKMSAFSAMLLFFGSAYAQDAPVLDTRRGNGWTDQGGPLVLSLNFQNYTHLHSQENENAGNSRHLINPEVTDPEDPNYILLGYKDMEDQKTYIGSTQVANLIFDECAFGPTWKTAYAFRDGETGENTPNVSNGFVEVSRDYVHSDIPVTQGYLTIDLGELDFIETLQYTVSSAGGDKRGFLLEYSKDGGTSWDSLRYQPGNTWSASFNVTDLYDNVRTPNGFRCDGSAYGLVWQDELFYALDEGEHFMVRFTIAGGQVMRLHDFKVYGELKTPSSLGSVEQNGLVIDFSQNSVRISEVAAVSVYNLTGTLLKSASNISELSISDLPAGIYVVRAENQKGVAVQKVLKR